ncbi:SET and MYND domain-containing protein 3 [Cadophora gregata]|uniref:SET and MYND domain-containing protein 3 n=1 Tax=Cadophora gregata TaxID=51156 RepID=UPI0026DC0682|nr:SET and MYND domain-containing protein 3 [Cadophora gregata]KAK0125697.1 SET and MYND domain-containing protein 3 [Cadophora gregata f. sp. sojae]KAK0128324.1 SET and MYND domain-containing protein 3 [Cadophora gregata]
MAAAALPSSKTQSEIPSRVKFEFILELRESKIPNGGRGLLVLQDVKAGELLFEVSDVLFSTIAADCLNTTCDNCFAHKSQYGKTDPRPYLSFTPCDTCKLSHYCSSACKESAWFTYHQFECHILAKMLSSESGWVGNANPRGEEFRTIIRLLTIHGAGVMPKKEWEEFVGLRPQSPAPDKEPQSIRGINEMFELIVKYKVTKLGMEDVEKIIRAYFNNHCFIQLWTPNELPLANSNRYPFVDVPVGECLEPFYSMINHCCDPNSTWLSEEGTLQVRAERDITVREELTICYGCLGTLEDRQKKLSGWIGKCTCCLCTNPPREPTGKLRDYVTKLITARGGDATPSQSRTISLQHAIQEMERVGLGLSAWPIRKLHVHLFRCRCGQYDGPNMLKTWLKLYYFVEPAIRPLECLANRNRSLAVLTYLLDLNAPGYANLEPYPDEVVKLAPWLHYQLRARLLHDIRHCHSKESYRVKVEEGLYELDFGQLERDAEAMAVKGERAYVPYLKSKESISAFVKDMNELLAWAELPARTESQLLSIHSI